MRVIIRENLTHTLVFCAFMVRQLRSCRERPVVIAVFLMSHRLKRVSESGVVEGPLGVLPGVIGTIQATEAIKCFLGCGELLTDRVLMYDALAMNFRTVTVKRNQDCPLCGESPSICEAEKRETNNIGKTT